MTDIMRHAIRLPAGLLTMFATVALGAESTVVRLHFLAGSREYHAAESLTAWAAALERSRTVRCHVSTATDKQRTPVAGLDQLADADLLVLFCRRLALPDSQLQQLRDYLESGRPILGIRTASHAVQNLPSLDREVLGGDYRGHGPAEPTIHVTVAPQAAQHPVLAGVEPWTRPGKLYRNPALADDVTVLLVGTGAAEMQPLAWVREAGGRRVFYTSMGFPRDFRNTNFMRLLENAVTWCLGRPR